MFAPLLFGWLALVGCGDKEAPQSQPVAIDGQKSAISTITMNTGTPKPVGVQELSGRLFAFRDMSVTEQQAVVGALNLVPAPCKVCTDKTIARCLVDGEINQCAVMDKLTKRAIRMAKNGSTVDTIKVEVNYPDFWIPRLGEGRPVNVILYNDPKGRFAADVDDIRSRLLEIFASDIRVTVHHESTDDMEQLGVRSRPTWFINGHRFRGVHSVDGLARFISYELADER